MGWSSALFFFFQAEDGIRDVAVTGVQTCALPIFPSVVAGEWQTRHHVDREGSRIMASPRCRRRSTIRTGGTLGRARGDRTRLWDSQAEIRAEDEARLARQKAGPRQTQPFSFRRAHIRNLRGR